MSYCKGVGWGGGGYQQGPGGEILQLSKADMFCNPLNNYSQKR